MAKIKVKKFVGTDNDGGKKCTGPGHTDYPGNHMCPCPNCIARFIPAYHPDCCGPPDSSGTWIDIWANEGLGRCVYCERTLGEVFRK